MRIAFVNVCRSPPAISNIVSGLEPRRKAPAVMGRSGRRSFGVSRGSILKNTKASAQHSRKSKFYAVRHGRDGFSGILKTWDECKPVVYGVKGAAYKSFKSYDEAQEFAFPPLNRTEGNALQSMDHAGLSKQAASMSHAGEVEDTTASLPLYSAEPVFEGPTTISVYTDGACSRNGKSASKAGYGVFFHEHSPYNVSKPLPGPPTNQRAELMAVLEAMQIVLQHNLLPHGGVLDIYTDSMYTKKGIESWTANWKRNKWKTSKDTDVKNRDLWEALDDTKRALIMMRIQISLNWVKGHCGHPGNEAADRLAVNGMASHA